MDDLDDTERALLDRTAAWAASLGLPASRGAVGVATRYARRCGPADAADDALDAVARFVLLFLLVDDAPAEAARAMVAGGEPWSLGPHTGALRAWVAEVAPRAASAPRLWARIAGAFHDYLASRAAELDGPVAVATVEAHWALRRRTIFLEPFYDLWMLLTGLDPDAAEAAAEARALATDLVILANDLASVVRDATEAPDDLNLVRTVARARGTSEDEAVDVLVGWHADALARLRAFRQGPPAYLALLARVVDGNASCLRALRARYPGSEAVLARLGSVA